MMVRTLLLLAAACALSYVGASAQEEEGRPLMRDEDGNVVLRGGLELDENGDFVLRQTRARDEDGRIILGENGISVKVALDPAGDFEAASRKAVRAGLVLSPEGKWVAPTPESALRALREPSGFDRSNPVVAVMTRRFDDWPRPELDALADELVRIAIAEVPPSPEGRWWPRFRGDASEAQSILWASGMPRDH